MGRRRIVLAAVGVVGVVICVFAWLTRPPDTTAWPGLLAAGEAVNAGRIVVGPNVHLSTAAGGIDHLGCVLAADPTDPLTLIAASTLGESYSDIGVYFSRDAGATWAFAGKRPHEEFEQVADEDLAFGSDGVAYIVNMRVPVTTPGTQPYGTPGVGNIDFACSKDGGATWEQRASVSRYIDRPCLAIDGARMYVHANAEEAIVLVSDDGGGTFVEDKALKPAARSPRPSNPLVLASGDVLVTSAVFVSGEDLHVELPVWRSSDAGKTWVQLTPNLAGRWKHPHTRSASLFGVFYPRLASDGTRVYCVWRDGNDLDRSYILFSRSLDGGGTWCAPVIVSEQPQEPDGSGEYGADVPNIAVNKDGVVAVTWYDRRGLPPHTVGPGGVIPPVGGYNVRFRVSHDGGETWAPSVQLNEKTMTGDLMQARYWTGLAAAADGRFHAAWIGDSTGTRQVWTAGVKVAR